MIRIMQTITLSRLYKRPHYENDGLRQYLATKQDYETLKELIEHFKFSQKHNVSTERKFIERVLIPVFDTQKVEDQEDKNQKQFIEVDEGRRVKQPGILSKASENDFVKNATLTLLKKLESDGIIKKTLGAGGGYNLNYTTKELLEHINNNEQIPKTSKTAHTLYNRIY